MTLFACSKCYARHPFEELSAGQQLCKSCRSSSNHPIVKCTFCRTEFQSKSTTVSTCKKCEENIKTHGKPQSCIYCNLIAAFIGKKCQRCANSEKKYGLPVACEQCKMQCAFDRKDEDKVDGKLLCWLCTLSYKRALAKSTISIRKHHDKDKRTNAKSSELSLPSSKKHKPNLTTQKQENKPLDLDGHNFSEHVVAVTELREQIATLNRQVMQKDKELLMKERQITDLRAANFTTETELRNKLKENQRDYEGKVEQMNAKLKQMQKELAKKDKLKNKSSLTIVSSRSSSKDMEEDVRTGDDSD